MKPENFAQIPLHMIYQALQGVRSFNILTIFRSCQPNSPYDSDNQTCDRPWPTEILMLGRTKTNPLDEITLNLPNLPALVLFFFYFGVASSCISLDSPALQTLAKFYNFQIIQQICQFPARLEFSSLFSRSKEEACPGQC